MATELFEDIFSSHGSGCERVCSCGVVHFDTYNTWDWEEGELEDLEAKQEKEPDKYIGRGYSVGTVIVDGQEYVYGCPCKGSDKYEEFIISHAARIAQYLNKRSEQMIAKAKSIEVTK